MTRLWRVGYAVLSTTKKPGCLVLWCAGYNDPLVICWYEYSFQKIPVGLISFNCIGKTMVFNNGKVHNSLSNFKHVLNSDVYFSNDSLSFNAVWPPKWYKCKKPPHKAEASWKKFFSSWTLPGGNWSGQRGNPSRTYRINNDDRSQLLEGCQK